MDTEILNRYFQGKCTAEEMLLVNTWFKTTEGQNYISSRLYEDFLLADTDRLDENLYEIDSEKLLNKIIHAKTALGSLPVKENFRNEPERDVKIIQHNWRIIPIWVRYAAMLTGIFILAFAYWIATRSSTITEQTAFGETKTITLPDGSTVILNGNSSIRYQTDWSNVHVREVWLDGEAFFSITHLPDHQKFVVNTADNFNVEVLGTTFNVLKREQKTKVVLNTGKIKLNIRSDESTEEQLVMNPGELVEFDNISTTYVKRRVNPEAHSSWKTNKMIFENTSLSEIMMLLEHTYGLQVEVSDKSLLNQKLNGSIPNENVDVLLEGLSHLFNLKISRNKQKIIIHNE